MLTSRQADIQSAKNDAALMTATAYFYVHQYRGMYTGRFTASSEDATWSTASPA